jgi:uncharacterized oligopeptide transporter (OPT) family protein
VRGHSTRYWVLLVLVSLPIVVFYYYMLYNISDESWNTVIKYIGALFLAGFLFGLMKGIIAAVLDEAE